MLAPAMSDNITRSIMNEQQVKVPGNTGRPRRSGKAEPQILGFLTARIGVSAWLTGSRRLRCNWNAGFIQTPLLLWMPAQL